MNRYAERTEKNDFKIEARYGVAMGKVRSRYVEASRKVRERYEEASR